MNEVSPSRPRTCVVISYWNGVSAKPLHRLLSQLQRIDSGTTFDLTIVCNGGDKTPLQLPARFDDLKPRILNRENVGYNIAAWEHGWRASDRYDYYLFLQDDCFLRRRFWLTPFETRMDGDRGLGLLGEQVIYDQMSYEFVRAKYYHWYAGDPSTWPEPEHPLDFYERLYIARGWTMPESPRHVPSIIFFTSRRVLEDIGGFPYFGPSYREAIASELAISLLVAAKGYRFSKVEDQPFEFIGHAEWSDSLRHSPRRLLHNAWWRAKSGVRMLVGDRNALAERRRPQS